MPAPIRMLRKLSDKISNSSFSSHTADTNINSMRQMNGSSGSSPRNNNHSLSSNEDLRSIEDPQKLYDVLLKKLAFCTGRMNFFKDTPEDICKRDKKRQMLLNLTEFLTELKSKPSTSGISDKRENRFSKIIVSPTDGFNLNVLRPMLLMVSSNLFLEHVAQKEGFDEEEDDPVLDISWPHKQVILEFLLRLVVCPYLSVKYSKKSGLFDQYFILKLLYLFESADPRERDYLKSILHRLYGKFFTHRRFIREQIGNVFITFLNEDIQHMGIAELLEILGSIINGFALPLKKEHKKFLRNCLLPLHKSNFYATYQHQLTYSLVQYIEKDKSIALHVLKNLFYLWPWSSSTKQQNFLNELEEVLEAMHPLDPVSLQVLKESGGLLFQTLSQIIASDHFQVAEKALFLWNNASLNTNGCLSFVYAEDALPILYRGLMKNIDESHPHWNPTVSSLSEGVLSLYKASLSPQEFQKLTSKGRDDRGQNGEDVWKEVQTITAEK
eukprot:augustus_masked-scaffold_6-processed-gene-7.7-mRNA-1 protein AED:0.01 eAED:0.01 QI:0/-1/0/1/-1/1/1/0/496